jgi:predicted secreted hydrolase
MSRCGQIAGVLLALLLAGCEPADDPARMSFVPLRIGSVLGDTDVQGFARAEHIREFVFPYDHGAHPEYRSEWWYLTLTLRDAAGNDYGIQFTVFRQALAARNDSANPWSNPQVYLGHLAITDVSGRSHREFERFARGHPQLAGARAQPFAVWLDGWRLEQTQPGIWLLTASADNASIRLHLRDAEPVLLQGESGLSRKGPEQASYYFSIPGFQVDGSLTLNGTEHLVSGGGWYDREWSTSVLSEGQKGWDWFALRFDSGASLMAFQLRRSDGVQDPYNYAISVPSRGATQRFSATQFTLQPQRFWQDADGTRWPVAWSIDLAGERYSVVAALDDQRMDTSLVYWEGLVYVYDQRQRRIGQGYMELTGYSDE